MQIDWEMAQKLGTNTLLIILIIYGAFVIIKRMLDMFEKYLARAEEKQDKLIQRHEEERAKWLEAYEKYSEKLDRAMNYQREEHQEIMGLLRAKIHG